MVESVNKIKAYRDGQTGEFTPKVWDAMGVGHCGWTAVPDVPKEVSLAEGRMLVREVYGVPPGIEPPITEGVQFFKPPPEGTREETGLLRFAEKSPKPRKTRKRND